MCRIVSCASLYLLWWRSGIWRFIPIDRDHHLVWATLLHSHTHTHTHPFARGRRMDEKTTFRTVHIRNAVWREFCCSIIKFTLAHTAFTTVCKWQHWKFSVICIHGRVIFNIKWFLLSVHCIQYILNLCKRFQAKRMCKIVCYRAGEIEEARARKREGEGEKVSTRYRNRAAE